MIFLVLQLMIVLLARTRHEICQLKQNRLQSFELESYKFEKFFLSIYMCKQLKSITLHLFITYLVVNVFYEI